MKGGEYCVRFTPELGRASPAILTLFEVVVSERKELGLNRARSHFSRRAKNELAHFSATYRNEFYNDVDESSGLQLTEDLNSRALLPKNAQELSYKVIVEELYSGNRIDFNSRAFAMLKDRPLKVLSICSGAARTERKYLRGLGKRIELTLVDLNADLLSMARGKLKEFNQVSTIATDVNRLSLPQDEYDVAICVSGLHHIVELEHVFSEVNKSLKPEGEFWSIGEYVGKNGARLWSEAYSVANNYFQALPSKYRLNHTAHPRPQVDEYLPNKDCSLETFEGIRSEEILELLDSTFHRVDVQTFDCFSWRLFDMAYAANYDMSSPVDRSYVEEAAKLDAELQSKGVLRPVAHFGVYAKKAAFLE